MKFIEPSLANASSNNQVTDMSKCTLPNLRWSNIRAFAEHKTNAGAFGDELVLDLLDRARSIFFHQPTRTHLHCFTICGVYLRCHLITRSGMAMSQAFSIHRQPERTLRVISAFFCGSLEWLGLKTAYYVKDDRGNRQPYDCSSQKMEGIDPYYDFQTPDGMDHTLVVDIKDPVCRRKELISRGTVCFKARSSTEPEGLWTKVIKEAWRMANRESEGDIWAKIPADQRKIPGLAEYLHHEEVTKTASIRKVGFENAYLFHLQSPMEKQPLGYGNRKRNSSDARIGSGGRSASTSKRIKHNPGFKQLERIEEVNEAYKEVEKADVSATEH
jgi:hypothetical protein